MDVEVEELSGHPDMGYRYRLTCGGQSYEVALEHETSVITILINGQLYSPPDEHFLSWPPALSAAKQRVRELCAAQQVR